MENEKVETITEDDTWILYGYLNPSSKRMSVYILEW